MTSPNPITMIAGDGSIAQVPTQSVPTALSKGAKFAVQMRAPDGSEAWVPSDQLGPAMKRGAKIIQQAQNQSTPTQFEQNVANQPTYGSEIYGGLKRAVSSIVGQAQAFAPQTTTDKVMSDLLGPAYMGAKALKGMAQSTYQGLAAGAQARRTATAQGEGLPGQILATAEQYPLVGPMVQHAEQGAASPIPGQGLGTQANIGTPQAYGAATEGATYAVAPDAIRGVLSAVDAIPNMERAGQNFAAVKSAVGDMPVDIREAGNIALNTQDLAARGGQMPKVMRDFIKRTTDPNQGPLTYSEARDFYSNSTRLSADEMKRLTPVVRARVAQFTDALGRSIGATAEQGGVGGTLKSAMNEYAAAGRNQRRMSMAASLAKKSLPYVGGLYVAHEIAQGRK